ncbi:hypothetical protein FOE33_24475 [Salmonella enterica]|nr:hypothetical protein [Salmonella enterica]ECH4042237.1 hypothetical protein [Salmonella enterica]
MKMKTKPLLLAVAVSLALSNSALATYTQNVAAGDTVTNEVVDSTSNPGTNNQDVYGTAIDTTINSGAYQNVKDGGVAKGSVVQGGLTVDKGGVAESSKVESTGSLLNTGKIYSTEVSGYLQSMGGGEDYDTVIKSGGSFRIAGSDTDVTKSFNATIENGASVDVARNAELNNWDISGSVKVYRDIYDNYTDFPVFNDATVNNGGRVQLDYGSQMFNTTINGGRVDFTSLTPALAQPQIPVYRLSKLEGEVQTSPSPIMVMLLMLVLTNIIWSLMVKEDGRCLHKRSLNLPPILILNQRRNLHLIQNRHQSQHLNRNQRQNLHLTRLQLHRQLPQVPPPFCLWQRSIL